MEDVALEFIRKEVSDEFPDVDRFWDRRGNEIDIVGINRKKREMLLVEVKTKDLSPAAVRSIINGLEKKSGLVPFQAKNVRYGVIAPRIHGRGTMEKDIWTLGDLLKG